MLQSSTEGYRMNPSYCVLSGLALEPTLATRRGERLRGDSVLSHSGEMEALLINAHYHRQGNVPGLFDLSMPYRLCVARDAQVICVSLDDGRSLGGDVGYVGTFGLTFSQPQRSRRVSGDLFQRQQSAEESSDGSNIITV